MSDPHLDSEMRVFSSKGSDSKKISSCCPAAPLRGTTRGKGIGVQSKEGKQPLDAQAEFGTLALASLGVEVVGGAVVELVALAQLAARKDADRCHSHSQRKPANHTQRAGFFCLFGFVFGDQCFRLSGHGLAFSYQNIISRYRLNKCDGCQGISALEVAGPCQALLDCVDASQPRGFRLRGKKARSEGIAGKLAEFIAGKALLSVGQQKFVGQIGAEEGRVVGVKRDEQAEIEEAAQRVCAN